MPSDLFLQSHFYSGRSVIKIMAALLIGASDTESITHESFHRLAPTGEEQAWTIPSDLFMYIEAIVVLRQMKTMVDAL